MQRKAGHSGGRVILLQKGIQAGCRSQVNRPAKWRLPKEVEMQMRERICGRRSAQQQFVQPPTIRVMQGMLPRQKAGQRPQKRGGQYAWQAGARGPPLKPLANKRGQNIVSQSASANAGLCRQATGHVGHPYLEVLLSLATPNGRKEFKVKSPVADSGAQITIVPASLLSQEGIAVTGVLRFQTNLGDICPGKVSIFLIFTLSSVWRFMLFLYLRSLVIV